MAKKSGNMTKILLGAHVSAIGGVDTSFERAARLDSTVMQIFLSNARQWKPPQIDKDTAARFLANKAKTAILPIAHASYLINCASIHKEVRAKSLLLLSAELAACELLEIPYYVLHPGNHQDMDKTKAIKKAAQIIDRAFKNSKNTGTMLLLETTASPAKSIGGDFQDIRQIIMESGNSQRLGVCLDTCHVFQAGWNIAVRNGYDEMFEEFDRIIGFKNLKCIHLNDAKAELGRQLDRHAHIGEGQIGRKGFSFFMQDIRLKQIPKCIETPKSRDDENDILNLSILRAMAIKKRLPSGVFKERGT